MLRVEIETQDKRVYEFGPWVDTTMEATVVAKVLERLFNEWEASGFAEPAPPYEAVSHYEGCEVYATGLDGTRWYQNPDGIWEVA